MESRHCAQPWAKRIGAIRGWSTSARASTGSGRSIPAFDLHGGLAGYASGWANWMAENGNLTHQSLSPMFGLGLSTVGENILVGPGNMPIVISRTRAPWVRT